MNEAEVYAKLKKEKPEMVKEIEFLQQKGFLETQESAEKAEKALVIICTGASKGVVGSQQARCSHCHQVVWLAPSSQAILRIRDKKPTILVCTNCISEAL